MPIVRAEGTADIGHQVYIEHGTVLGESLEKLSNSMYFDDAGTPHADINEKIQQSAKENQAGIRLSLIKI